MNQYNQEKSLHLVVRETKDIQKRVDKFITEQTSLFSRSQFKQRLVEVRINNKKAKLSQRLKQGDRLEIIYTLPPAIDIIPENIPLDILYEDDQAIIINKPQGLAVHPGSGRSTGTLVNALVYHFQDIKENFIDEPLRPGIVHRLDKDTSGVLVVAKNKPAHEYLASQFRNRAIRKYYLAIVQGKPAQPAGKIKTRLIRDPRHRQRFTWAKDTPLSGDAKSKGKVGVTFYKVLRTSVLETSSAYSLILFKPLTGRTHQLRVHALRLGCPILGDPIYGRPDKYFSEATLMLHAYRITLQLPGQAENSSFKAPIPLRFKQILSRFKTN